MRILMLHGYLLGGTGSNVYTAQLARTLVEAGHEVHVVCQERAAERLDFVGAVGDWEGGPLRVRRLGEPGCTVYRPDIGGLLPVYVADRYEGLEARPFTELDEAELDRYLRANVAAVREVVERARPDLALAGHLVMAPAVAARALGDEVPYAVKVHGSALEYTVKRDLARFLPFAREGLARARCVLVGSRHTAQSLWAALDDPTLPRRTRLGPPGVDVHRFVPRPPAEAAARLGRLAASLRAAEPGAAPASAFDRDLPAIGAALARLDAGRPLVAYVGKLIVSKGIDLLAAAWPLVLQRVPDATLAVVGFGAWRGALERLVDRLAAGDEDGVRALAAAGRAEEGGPRAPLAHLLAFLDGLGAAARERYMAAARALPERVVVVGRLEHDELVELLPACTAQVVPSTFPEAFGMVAAEAAACGVLPVSAAHSGLAEVSALLAAELPADVAPLLAFPVGPGAVEAIADRLVAWLTAPADVRARTRSALVDVARRRFSWEGVAAGVVAAAQGRLDALPEPPRVA